MIDGEVAVGEGGQAAVALAFLLPEEVAAVGVDIRGRNIAEVGALRNVGAVRAFVEEAELLL